MIASTLIAFAAGNAAMAALAGVAAYGTFVPCSQLWGRVVVRGPKEQSSDIALTFDDGPTPGPTERVLDVLADAGVKATFFVIGVNCRASPELLRRIHTEGHLIGNHTFDHSHHGWLGSAGYWDRQLSATDDAIAEILGVRPALFRPPMGIKTFYTQRAAKNLGQQVIGWTRKARDGVSTTAPAILDRLAEPTHGGDILLLHDGVEPNTSSIDRQPTLTALPTLIARLKDRGLTMRRLDELLECPGYRDPK